VFKEVTRIVPEAFFTNSPEQTQPLLFTVNAGTETEVSLNSSVAAGWYVD